MSLTLVESKKILSEEDRIKAQGILESEGYWWDGSVIVSVDIDSHNIEPRRVIIHSKDRNNKNYSRILTYKFWLNPEKKNKVKEDEFVIPKRPRRT